MGQYFACIICWPQILIIFKCQHVNCSIKFPPFPSVYFFPLESLLLFSNIACFSELDHKDCVDSSLVEFCFLFLEFILFSPHTHRIHSLFHCYIIFLMGLQQKEHLRLILCLLAFVHFNLPLADSLIGFRMLGCWAGKIAWR